MLEKKMMQRRRWGSIPLVVGLLVASGLVVSCTGDPQAKKAKHVQRGEAYLNAAQYPEAMIELKNAVQLDPRDAQLRYTLATVYLRMGGLSSWQQALKELTSSVELDPTLREAQLELGRLYFLAKDFDKAQATAEVILDQAPEHHDAYTLLGHSLAKQQRFGEAAAALEKAIVLNPMHLPSYAHLATVYAIQKDFAAAERTYQSALARDPHAIAIHLALGDLYRVQGNTQAAEEVYTRATSLAPQEVSPHLHLATLYTSQKKFVEAEAQYLEAVRLAPNHDTVRLTLADFYAVSGQTAAAIAAYQKAIELNPLALPAKKKLADLLLSARRIDEASWVIAEILQQRRGDVDGYYLQGRVQLDMRQFTEAVATLQHVIQETAKFAPAHYYLGLAHLGNQNAQAARRAFLAALEIAPAYVEPRLALAQLHLDAKSYDQAIEEGEKILQAHRDHVGAHRLMGDASLGKDDLRKAREAYATVIRLAPRDPLGHYGLGLVDRAAKNEPEALAAFERALALNPHFIQALSQIADLYLARGDGQRALERTLQHGERAPDNASLQNLLGHIYMRQRQSDAAEMAFKKAIELKPDLVVAYINLASVYAKGGGYAQAVQEYQKILLKNPDFLPSYMLIGVLYERQQEYEKAMASYKQALERNPKFAPAANNLAWLYAEHGGDIDVALSLAQTAREALPGEPHIADTLGWIYYRKNLYLKAISMLRESAAKLPNNPVVHYHLGMAYFKNMDKELARKSLELSLKLGRDYAGAEEARRTLSML